MVSEDLGFKLEKVDATMLGQAKKVRAQGLGVGLGVGVRGSGTQARPAERRRGGRAGRRSCNQLRLVAHVCCLLTKPRPNTRCKQVTISKDDTVILNGGGERAAIAERCDMIRQSMEVGVACLLLLLALMLPRLGRPRPALRADPPPAACRLSTLAKSAPCHPRLLQPTQLPPTPATYTGLHL